MFNFFFLYRLPSSSLCAVFDGISFNTDEILSINPSVNMLIFEDFNVRHKDWLTYYDGSLTMTLTALLVCISFFLLTLVLVLQMISLHWEILIMLLSQLPLTFHQAENRIPRFIA